MALTLVATPGDADANTYATLAEAEDFMEGRSDLPGWTSSTASQKNRALVMATSEIDSHLLYGTPHADDEDGCTLHFPTELCEDADTGALVIPAEVRDATAILAAYIRQLASGNATQLAMLRAQGVTGMSEGRLSVQLGAGRSESLGATAWRACSEAQKLLGTTRNYMNDYQGWLLRSVPMQPTL
jgi:hypothetical protein